MDEENPQPEPPWEDPLEASQDRANAHIVAAWERKGRGRAVWAPPNAWALPWPGTNPFDIASQARANAHILAERKRKFRENDARIAELRERKKMLGNSPDAPP